MASEVLSSLARRLQARCLERGIAVATAESCTGGLVADAITDVPGSSEYFRGAIVAYSNEAKTALLGVPGELLTAHGAVSAQVARAMALGARERLGTELAVSVTGVAGPGGGTDAKPVGLTYLAVADAAGVDVWRRVWGGDRAANKESSAIAALEMLLARLDAASGAGTEASAGHADAEQPRSGETGSAEPAAPPTGSSNMGD